MDSEIDYDNTKIGVLTLKNGAEIMGIASNSEALSAEGRIGLYGRSRPF